MCYTPLKMAEFDLRDMADCKLHTRIRDGCWEVLRTDKPTKYQDALNMEGWQTIMEFSESYKKELKQWEDDIEAARRTVGKQRDVIELIAEIGALEKEVSHLKYLLQCMDGRLTASDELSDMAFYDARLKLQVDDALIGGRNAG